ncbi:MAG: hypothetical protein AAF599_03045 [Bacteroidota bacterium]
MLKTIKPLPQKIQPVKLAIFGRIPNNWKEEIETQFDCLFAQGYEGNDYIDEALINEAQRKSQLAEWVIIFTHTETNRLPMSQHQLIRSVQLLQENIIVLVQSKTLSHLPWAANAKAIIQFEEEVDWPAISTQLLEKDIT